MSFLRHTTLLLFLSCLWLRVGGQLYAQRETVKNQPYVDARPYHLGFFVGMHLEPVYLYNSGVALPDNSRMYADAGNILPGFSVGVVAVKSFSPLFSLRLLPSLSFGERSIAFSDGKRELSRQSIRSQYLSLPIMLKYASSRLNNIRPYITAGGYSALNIASGKSATLRMKAFDLGFRVGVGIDIYLKHFKLCPELSYSRGLVNILQKDRPDLQDDDRRFFTESLRRLSSGMILFAINFE